MTTKTSRFYTFWHSLNPLPSTLRIIALFLGLWVLFLAGSWSFYEFSPQSVFFTYDDVRAIGLKDDGTLVVESEREIRWSGLYRFNDTLLCLVAGVGTEDGWEAVANEETTAPAIAQARIIPPQRWNFRASRGIWNDEVPTPVTCRFLTLVRLELPRSVIRKQVLFGSEFIVGEGVSEAAGR